MAEREADMEEDAGDLPAREGDNDSDREEDEGLFFWMVNEDMEEDDEDDEVEDEQPVDTEASESFELDTPAERSGQHAIPQSSSRLCYSRKQRLCVRWSIQGDAWLYCVSRNEWKPFKHSHTESPRLEEIHRITHLSVLCRK
ncbi:hypothetical protein XENOCAPTIV_020796 [Xenoophorus captivus]|uniref:Uncharacterized protein n=1 Tax=Xenoophorus captivus TaxID=1517983 RepID=A0ABV0QNG4_9TELE